MPNHLSIDLMLCREVVEKVADHLERLYVFPALGSQMAAQLRLQLQQGVYDHLTDAAMLCAALTNQMRESSHDKHLRVDYHVEPQAPGTNLYKDPEAMAIYWAKAALDNYGFQEVKRLAGNVGYVKLTAIEEAEETAPTIAAAMAFVSNTNALIIDIRDNTGGAPTGVAFLCSYFVGSEPVHLIDVYSRADNTTQQFWTFPSLPGKRYLGKPVYILTSARTPSAGEELAYDLQHLKRATLVGETTVGAAHLIDVYQLNPHFELRVSVGRAVHPLTGENWEGRGVIPDIPVPAEEALPVAYRYALQHILLTAEQSSTTPMRHLLREVQGALAQLEAAKPQP
jgi:retinol-binding protein 3